MLKKVSQECRAILSEEGGQTMLEYVVIVVFVVIAVIIIYRIVSPLNRSLIRASVSIEQ